MLVRDFDIVDSYCLNGRVSLYFEVSVYILQVALIREYQAEIKYLKQNKEKATEVEIFYIRCSRLFSTLS